MFEEGGSPKAIVEAKGLVQITDEGAIAGMVEELLNANPEKVEEYRSGKDKLFGFFVGQLMKISGGKVNPAVANKILKEKLS